MSTIDPETGHVIAQRSPRFTIWVAFLIFATVALGSSVEVKNTSSDPSSDIKWAVACSAITFGFSLLVTIGHMVTLVGSIVVGTRIEGMLTFILTGFWAVTVAVVTKSNGNVGIGVLTTSVLNGNLYYSSWAGFITSVVLFVDYLKEAFGVDIIGQVQNRSARLSIWASLLAASFIVMGSSVRVLQSDCKNTTESGYSATYCKRTDFAIGAGTSTCVLCLVIIGLKLFTSMAPLFIELVVGSLLTVMNAFAVAFITSSANGPGALIGNLYYASWICFLASAMVTAEAMNERSTAQAYSASSSATPSAPKASDDIEMEQI